MNTSGILTLTMGGAMSADWSVAVVIVAFIILAILLNVLLFKPMMAVLEQREQRTQGVKEAVAALEEKSGTLEEDYKKRLQQARLKAVELRNSIRQEGEGASEEILTKAREESLKLMEDGKGKVYQMEEEARKDLNARAKALSLSVCQQVMGRQL